MPALARPVPTSPGGWPGDGDSIGESLVNAATAATPADLPPAPTSLSFQQGIAGYSGTVDTFLEQDQPSANHGSEATFEWDDGNGSDEIALLRFDSIFGPAANQIPLGATLASATLTYVVYNKGNPSSVNEVAIDWTEAVNFNSFGTTPGVQAGDLGASRGSANGPSTDTYDLDVTASLAAWAANPAANRGWIFQPTGTNGVGVRSSEYSTLASRPALTVVFVLAANTDLALTSVNPDPANVLAGEGVAVTVVVTNQGSQDISENVVVSLEDLTQVGFIGSATIIGGLNAGESAEVVLDWDTSGANAGVHDLSASHDLADDLESNDSGGAAVLVVLPVTDLAIDSVTPTPASVLVGDSVSVSVVVANLGNQDVSVDVIVSLVDLTQVGMIGSATIFGGLNAGELATVAILWNTSGAALGVHDLNASHDLADDLGSNDSGAAAVTVALPVTDLAIDSVTPVPAGVLVGNSVNVSVAITNLGNQDVSDDVIVSLEDLTQVGFIGSATIVGGLNAGESATVVIAWNTSGASLGVHDLRASHDLADDLASNNSGVAAVTITEPSADPITLSFQQGIAGYSDTVDTFLEQDRPSSSHGSDAAFEWDDGDGNDETALLLLATSKVGHFFE